LKITRFLIAALLFLALPAAIAAETPETSTPQNIKITADSEQYSFDDGLFHAQGNVRVTCGDIYLTADNVTGSLQTGRIEASGKVRLVRETSTLTADKLDYTFPTAGAKNAEADSRFYAKGNVIIDRDSVTLQADTVEGDPSTGDVEATGNVTFKDAQRTLTGNTFKYNFKTNTGDATNAVAAISSDSMQPNEPPSVLDNGEGTLYFRGQEL
jgi:lipopolysaccharide assembly outer membrane protein LptD (OstA)